MIQSTSRNRSKKKQQGQFEKHQRILYLKHIIISTLIHFALSLFSFYYMEPYSHQNCLYSNTFFPYFANFDGFHYIDNLYTYLPNFAFLPGYSLFVRFVSTNLGPFAFLALSLINSFIVWFSALELAKICRNMNMSQNSSKKCGLLFIYNPAGVYYHSVYTESIYFYFTLKFISMAQRISPEKLIQNKKQVLKGVLFLMIAISIRSTALFLLPIIGIPILWNFFQLLCAKKLRAALSYFLLGSTILLLTCSVFIIYLVWSHSRICNSQRPLKQCSQSIFFNVYSYVQDKYWNVGFLKYYNSTNIVFILIGVPSLIFSTVMLHLPKNISDFSFQLSFWILLFIIIFMTNLQSSTRFLSSHPIFYINAILWREDCHQNKKNATKNVIWKLFEIWRLFYYFIGTVLFTLEFPWT